MPYPHVTVASAPNLSDRWALILRSYSEIGTLHLTYSPLSQNSNSMAGTALRRDVHAAAGIERRPALRT